MIISYDCYSSKLRGEWSSFQWWAFEVEMSNFLPFYTINVIHMVTNTKVLSYALHIRKLHQSLSTTVLFIFLYTLVKSYVVKWPTGEVGVSLPWWCPCPSTSRLPKTFLKSHNFFIMKKWSVSEEFQVKVETLKKSNFTR